MKIHNRICASCGDVLEQTRTKASHCFKCAQQKQKGATHVSDRALLETLYVDVVGPSEPNKNGKREWTFTHACCGTRQTWVMGNIKSRLKKNPDRTPCNGCKKH